MTALNHKLLRGLWKLRAQVIAVSMIIASGVGVLVMSLSSVAALQETTRAYYERYRFGDVFADARRAPDYIERRLAEIPGVLAVSTRVRQMATLDFDDFNEPVIGQIVSIPESIQPELNRLALVHGRLIASGASDEVVLNEPFARAHGLGPGSHFFAIINGTRRKLDVVGIAMSPEFVYSIGPGALMPDNKRYGILWMGRDALAAAYDLAGSFNSVSLALLPGTAEKPVLEAVDRLLKPYGGTSSVARENQLSNWFLMNELAQMRSMATMLPAIFLIVAAFLTNMVLARLIAIERGEIGLLKSFGYQNWQVAWHYAKLVICMSLVGVVLGWLIGAWLGRFNTQTYAEFFNFPILIFRPDPWLFIWAGLISLIAALTGSLGAVANAVRLPPAEAMRPPAPPQYGHGMIAGSGFVRLFDQSTRIILRQLARRPWRSLLTSLGVAFSVMTMIMALQWLDSIDRMLDDFFYKSQHQDAVIGLVEPQPLRVVNDVRHLPGVLAAEPMRWVGVDFRSGPRLHRGAIQAMSSESELQVIYDVNGRIVNVPADGLVLGTELAEKLRVGIGDRVWVDIKEGDRRTVQMTVVDLVKIDIDLPAYMDLNALHRIMSESTRAASINVLIDDALQDEFYEALKQTPNVSMVMLRKSAIQNFEDSMAETIVIFTGFFSVFAVALGFGVVYNSARITLSERGRELASLRVLGFSRAGVSYILLGEVALLVLLALPFGCLFGWGMAWLLVTTTFENEMFRLPLIIHPSSYGTAIAVVFLATMLSAVLVRMRLDRLDLIGVLKTRE